MKLSIITINLNNVTGLKRTIDSVLSQTFHDYEWVVIDGGSTDGGKELIEEHASFFSYWVSEPDSGIYNAMNKGIRQIHGEYVLFLNSGDWLYSDTVLYDVFKIPHSDDIIFGDISFCRDGKEVSRSQFPSNIGMNYLAWNFIGHSSNVFIKTRLLYDYPYDETLSIVSDWKLYLQASLDGATFKHIHLLVGCYDLSGISEKQRAKAHEERDNVFDKNIPQLIKADVYQNKELESYLANTTVEEFIRLRRKHIYLGKLLTSVILLLKKLG